MSTFSYLLLLGNLFFRVGIILAISKKAGDRLPSAPLEMKPMVSPTDLSPKLHWPSGPQGHNVCSPASWKHTRSAEFSLYIFTISLSWLEESTKFISKKKERTVSTRSVVIRGYFAICTPATQEGNAKIHFAPIKLEAVLLKETLVWWRWNEKLIKIIMFGSMRLSAWKHKRDPASRGGNYPQTFHFLGGGSRKTHRSPKYTAHALPEERRQKNFWNTAFVDLWACLFLHSVSPQQQVMFQEGGCGHKGTRLWTTKCLAFRFGRQCHPTPSSSQMCRIRWWDSGFRSLNPNYGWGRGWEDPASNLLALHPQSSWCWW